MAHCRPAAGLLIAALACSPVPVQAQTGPTLGGGSPEKAALLQPPSLSEEAEPSADADPPGDPTLRPVRPANPEKPAAPEGFLRQLHLDYTFLPGLGKKSLTINDVELSGTMALPLAEGWAPLLLTPGVAGHFWDGPSADLVPPARDLPSHLYDTYLEIGWRPQLARWLFTDLAVTPGVYSDFRDVSADSFQMRGRGLAIVAFSPQFQIVGGALYVNRNKTKILPAGGFIWNPNDDTKLVVVFPSPKLAHRLTTLDDIQLWGYLSGELGGGRWSMEHADGTIDSVDYTDIRVILGLETIAPGTVKGHVEVGYVFARRVNFTGTTPDYRPDPTLMLRAGISY